MNMISKLESVWQRPSVSIQALAELVESDVPKVDRSILEGFLDGTLPAEDRSLVEMAIASWTQWREEFLMLQRQRLQASTPAPTLT